MKQFPDISAGKGYLSHQVIVQNEFADSLGISTPSQDTLKLKIPEDKEDQIVSYCEEDTTVALFSNKISNFSMALEFHPSA